MRIPLLLLLLTLMAPVAAQAQPTRCAPVFLGDVHISEETAGFVITLAYPVLCSSDATRILRDHVTHALAEFKLEFPEHDLTEFPHKYEMIVQYKTWSAGNGRLASVKLHTMAYTGGAHPNNWPETWVFDLVTGKPLTLADLFVKTEDALIEIAPVVRTALKKTLGQMCLEDMLLPGTTPTPDNYADFVLTDQGVTFFFAPYQVAPYAAGEQAVSIPYQQLETFLSPKLKSLLK